MKPTRYLLVLLTLIFFVQSSCKKSTPAKTNAEYLTQKPWVLVKQQEKISGVQSEWLDVTQNFACSVDDTYTYTAAGNYIQEEGATKCSPSDQQTLTTNWALSTDGNMITRITIDALGSYILKQLDDNTLIVEYVAITPRITVNRRSTFGHR